jgi:hypothetical protein
MAVTNLPVEVPTGTRRFEDSVSGATAVAVKASSGKIYAIIVDNALNAAASFVKLYDLAQGSVTVGTTPPDFILKVANAVKKTIHFPDGIDFATALTIATTTANGLGGTTPPTSACIVTVVYS